MDAKTLRLVLLVSACHALVHVYELSFSSVEQIVAGHFGVTQAVTGWLGFSLRLPFGLCALAGGWLADRFGAKRLLLVYLFGCAAAALGAWASPNLAVLFLAMFALGTLASIYHPAGVSLISHHTVPDNRPLALGYHGILGSAGVAAGPFLAAAVLGTGSGWKTYYLVLTLPGTLLGLALWRTLPSDPPTEIHRRTPNPDPQASPDARWDRYWTLILATILAGFVYSAVTTFLPRYLDGAGLDLSRMPKESLRNVLAGGVLVLGTIGQYTAGRIAKPRTLEPLLTLVFLAAAPCLLWMGLAAGVWRVVAAALFAAIFFMHQPLYNALVAQYVPRNRRSLAYGVSFSLGFGGGSIGSAVAGKLATHFAQHGTLINHAIFSALILLASLLCAWLWRTNGQGRTDSSPLREAMGQGT